ncbi:PREDICTED: uncharacterized protein LOC108775856 [Cyphomyrmex costatus]|uniref:Pericentriolar material 1 protein n=1 Tax=Cyphomyrmex costatus TaxID=456900 RepID=A0A195CJ17_9HYME|nr:PREDICTED: uncharacterized protein LOC108775856 [Cyphomyrmex costatus]KYN00427.1 hypothetical protein ALC62_08731 [Cyphomyrmex costatus]
MSPGVNGGGGGGGPRNTGTLPKSNRRSDRNRERSAANQQNRSAYHGHPQHFNNLFQLDWQVASEYDRESRVSREAKNSNTRSASSQLPSSYFTTYQDLPDFISHNSARQCNYTTEDCTPWLKMIPFTDPRTQSPSQLQGTKPSNVNKMPERSQVESRLNQIRDYIRVTATMIDSLSQSSDPRAQAQSEKLSRMVEDLHDSETKLSKLLEQYHNNGISDENGEREDIDECGDASREMQLRRNMEEYQNKLAQLQEQQANLADMQMCVRERLNKARQAQQVLLQQENQSTSNSSTWEDNRASLSSPANVEQLESETAALRGKLAQLQTKKKQMDHLVAELQAIETSDRGSCSSEGSRNTMKDKTMELEAMKAQLAHIKALMEDGTKIRDSIDFSSEPEQDIDVHDESATDGITEDMANASFENRSNDVNHTKIRSYESNISDIQTLTSELKEQSILLQNTRAKLQRLKQPLPTTAHIASSNCPFSRPPPALIPLSANEKKQSFNASTEIQAKQAKKHQLEDLIRKEPSQPSNTNRDVQALDQNSQRSSGSQASHTSTPANIWPSVSAGAGGSNEQSVDGVSTSENLLDIGPPAAIENGGVVGNLWTYPIPPPSINQGQTATVEYYRQLLLGSQAHQLQMMGTTMQQCCQLLWSQQRELQSMRAAIAELQLRSQNQAPQRINNAENQEEHSNLSRSVHNLGDTLDATLPPSSSLPNLVSLPNSSATLSHTPVVSSNLQQQQQQQLNNQVPPGNRANNYWDNFRSYSRQNLLSGNVKTMTDSPTGIANSACSANTTNTSSVNSSLIKERNRDQGSDNLTLPLIGAETQYSLNLQLPSNLQQQDRENTTIRSNIITNEMSQQVDNLWEEAHSSFRLSATNDDNLFNNLSSELKEAISSLIAVNKRRPDYLIIILREIKAISEDHRLRSHLLRSLRALQDKQTLNNPLNEAPDLTPSESYQSSDEDSDADFALENVSMIDHSAMLKMVVMSQMSHVDTAPSPVLSQVPLIEHLEITGTSPVECASGVLSTSNAKPGYNEDLAEADQSRPESSGNQKLPTSDVDNEEGQEEAASYPITAEAATPDLESLVAKTEDERAEDTIDNFFRLH